jgi:inner membrane protein
MASLGHLAVGVAAARVYRHGAPERRAPLASMLLWSALSFLPDADVIGFSVGVRYEDEWGHRGASHSLVFALLVGVLVGLLAPRVNRPAIRTGLIATIVLASHGLLDTLTDGGLGIALFWPFDLTRYFAPLTPIPVAPIGLAFLSPYGFLVAAWEAVLFGPVWWFALSRTRHARLTARRAALLAVWLAAVWLFTSTDRIRERIVAFALQDNTEYASGFSERAFGQVDRGHTEREVRERLGAPFHEFLFYPPTADTCTQIRIDDDAVTVAQPEAACTKRGIRAGMSRQSLYETLGKPEGSCWIYSRSPDGGYFRGRGICFDGGRVDQVARRWIRE